MLEHSKCIILYDFVYTFDDKTKYIINNKFNYAQMCKIGTILRIGFLILYI